MSDNIFAQLQMVSQLNKEQTIRDTRKKLNQILEFMEHRESYQEQLYLFATVVRNLNVSTLQQAHGFMVEEDMLITELPEDLQHDSLGFCHGDYMTFHGRFVYPVFDVQGDVMGWCGYDKFVDPKYLDSINYGYKAKAYSLYGMEMLPTYYKNNEPVFFVEGIVCCLVLRQIGLQACAMLGSQVSAYVLEIIRRFGKRAIVFMDADEAGTALRKRLHRIAPEIRCLQSRVAKDIDDSRLVDPSFLLELPKLKDPFYRSKMVQ